MTLHRMALIMALAYTTSVVLSGCDQIGGLTEHEHIQRAKDYEDKGNLKASVVELKNAVQKNPESPQARLLLGELYLKLGMGAEAEKELTQAAKLGVSMEVIKPQLGEALLLSGQYQRVLDEIQPENETSKVNLARILQLRASALMKKGQLKDACSLLKQSLDADESNPATYWGLAQCAFAERDVLKAREWLDIALSRKSKQAKTWIQIGDLEQLNNNVEAALAAYTNALKLEPDNMEALRIRATINTTLGRMDAAQIDIEQLRKLAPKSLDFNYLQALFSHKEGKYSEARNSIQEALKIAPDYMPALLLAGSIEYALGNLQTAESHLNKVVRSAPKNRIALRTLAFIQLRLGRPDDAAKTLAPFDLEKVRDVNTLAIAGEIALAKKEYSKAASYFERATELSPDRSDIRTELGITRLVLGDNRAIADLQSAAEMDGASDRAVNVIILNQLKQKKFDAALDSIGAFEKRHSQNPLTWNYRGIAYQGKKDTAKARSSFNQALKLDPGFFPAAFNLAALDMLDNKPEAARKHFETILEKDKNNLNAMMALANLAASQKKEKDYVSWVEQAIKSNPKAMEPRTALVRYHLSRQENAKALNHAREAVNYNPGHPAALNLLGVTQHMTGDNLGAISTLTQLTRIAPASADVYRRLGEAQLAGKQRDAARASFSMALKLNSRDLKAAEALWRTEMQDNKPESALKVARQLQYDQPQAAIGHLLAANTLVAQKRYADGAKAYENALERGPDSSLLIKLYEAMALAGKSKDAEKRLLDWIKKYPDDSVARAFTANLYMSTGRDREAIALYEEILRKTKNNVPVLNNLSWLLRKQDPKRAMQYAERAMALAPNEANVKDTYALLLLDKGEVKRALSLMEGVVRQAPQNLNFQYHLALALKYNGEHARAQRTLKKILNEKRPFEEQHSAQALLRELEGRLP